VVLYNYEPRTIYYYTYYLTAYTIFIYYNTSYPFEDCYYLFINLHKFKALQLADITYLVTK